MSASVQWFNPSRVWVAAALGLAAGALAIEPRLLVVVLAPAVVALAIWRTDLTLAMLVVALYLNLSEVVAAYVPFFSVDKTLVPVALAAIAFRLWREGRWPDWDGPLALALGGYGLSLAASLFVADDPAVVFGGLEAYAKNAVILAVVVGLATDPAHVRVMAGSFVAAALLLGLAGTVQFLTASPAATFGGLAQVAGYSLGDAVDPFRLTGPLDDPNSYAQVLVPLVPLAWCFMVRHQPAWVRILGAAAVGLVLVAIVATYSRSALLVLGVLAVAICLTWHRRHAAAAVLGVGLLVAAGVALAPPAYTSRVAGLLDFVNRPIDTSVGEVALYGRRDEMRAAVAMAEDHPLFGVGFGHYVRNFQSYSNRFGYLPRQEDRQAHSLYLEIAAERGLFGVLAFAGVLLFVFARGLAGRRWLQARGRLDEARIIEAFLLALGAYLVFAVVLHRNYEHYFWLLVGGLLAASAAAASIGEAAPARPRLARWPDGARRQP